MFNKPGYVPPWEDLPEGPPEASDGPFVVVYRGHNQLLLDTRFVGPFTDWEEAYERLSELPALGINTTRGMSGVKYIAPLEQRL
jgi:hypothetical protein